MSKTTRAVLASVLICVVTGFGSSSGAAQASTVTHRAKSDIFPIRDEFKFEVASIRPISGQHYGFRAEPTQNGFNAELSLELLIRLGYTPYGFANWFVSDGAIRISNPPNWSGNFYEVKARVADADLEAWRNQGNHQELLHSALRDILKERFKLVIHGQPIEVSGLHLVTKGKGVKLKATPSGFVLPTGAPLVSGGVSVAEGRYRRHYYGASMDDLAAFLQFTTGHPIHNDTGLTGRYEFVIQQIEHPSQDAADRMDNWPIGQLGLALKSGKVPGINLIIDHVEKPSEN